MEIRDKRTIRNATYREYAFKTDHGEINVIRDEEHDYVLFEVIAEGEPSDVKTTFGLAGDDAKEFALVILGEVE